MLLHNTAYPKKTRLLSVLQIDKLVWNGADILAYIPIGPRKVQGTALDYAYHIFNLVSHLYLYYLNRVVSLHLVMFT